MKKEKIYNYFYIINNLINGHFYLGVHSTDSLADGYSGSGTALKRAIKKYGKENFELTPLKFFRTRKEALDFERETISPEFIDYYRGQCYNCVIGGGGGNLREGKTEDELKKWHEKISISHKKFTEEEQKEKHKIYFNTHMREYQKSYREEHREEYIPYMKNYYETHKEERKKYNQKPEVKARAREYNRKYYMKKKAEKQAAQQVIII